MILLLIIIIITSVTAKLESPPRIIVHPQAEELLFTVAKPEQPHSPFKIKCQAEGEPSPVYYWTKNGEKFDYQDYDDRIFPLPENGTLIFRIPSDVDQGQYQCFAENKYGIATSNSVLVRKTYINDISKEDNGKLTLTGNEGEPFGIDCNKPDGNKPESYPSSRIIWFLYYPEDNVTIRILRNYSPRITVDPTGTLWFSNLTEQDGSKKFYYMCYAVLDNQNIYQEVNKYFVNVIKLNSTNKNVYYPPKKQYVSRNIAALSGDDVELFCIFGGTPIPKLSWHKNNAEVIDNSDHYSLRNNNKSLLIKNITIDDQAMYSCTVNSIYNAINIFVQEKPYFTIKPEIIITKENENVTFQCQAQGTPRPEIKWLYNGKLITDTTIIINTNLIIKNVTNNNIGNYGCNATNSVGYIYQDVYLNIV